MSLFASLGHGDIWALSGISFASPVNDLLDKKNFTLEELLEEDELIQEVKSKNERLITELSTGNSVGILLDYVIKPVAPLDAEAAEDPEAIKQHDLRRFKYPYMACEVFCCEVPEILKLLVEDFDGIYLDKLFSFLSINAKLDCYLAGYFEKILEMLFRRMTIPMMRYFNNSGTELLTTFLNHIDNYSIMQIVQRLMLPHIPFSNSAELENIPYDEIKEFYQVNSDSSPYFL
jgi:serine/threonine-protein phosphatase 6 regulatory subunit 3